MSRSMTQGTGRRAAARMVAVLLLMGLLAASGAGSPVGPSTAMASGGTSPDPSGMHASDGFATPEDAIGEYVAGLAAADVDRILGAAAVDEMSSGFRFDLQVDRLQAMQLTQSLAPASDPFLVRVNEAVQASQLLGQVRNLVYSLLSTEAIDGNVIVPADKMRAEAFAAQVDPSRLSGLTVQEIRFPNATLEHDPRYLTNMATNASIYGADEMTERLALVSLDGKTYAVGFTLLRYGEGWKVASQTSALAGTSALGTAQAMTVDGYDRLTSGQ